MSRENVEAVRGNGTDLRPEPRRGGAIALRAVASLALAALALYWLFFAGFLGALGCDEGCASPEDAHRWQYTGQFVIAAVGVGCCLVGLSLGFTRYRRLSWRLLGVGLLVAAAWWTFVQQASL